MGNLKEETANYKGVEVQSLLKKLPNETAPASSFYETFIRYSTDVYLLTDSAFNIQYCSDAVAEILNYAPHEVIGKNILHAVHPDDIDSLKDWLSQIRKTPQKLLVLEYRVKSKDGTWTWIKNNARNLLEDVSVKSVLMQYRNVQAEKIADHALIQTEQRLSMLLNNTEESFIILNSRLRIITYNSSAQTHSPYFLQKELQSGFSILDFIAKEEVDEFIQLFEQVFQGTEMVRETQFIDALDQEHIYHHTFRPLFDNGGDITGVFITSTNITERKKLTEALAVNTGRLKTAQQIARLGYFEVNSFGKIVYSSQEFYEITGLSKTSDCPCNFSTFEGMCHPEDLKKVQNEFKIALLERKEFHLEFRFINKSGHEKVLLAIGGPTEREKGILKLRITLQDITDSTIAFQALQTLESRFKSLFENSLDGVITFKRGGEVISANPAACKMLGYTAEEITTLTRANLLDLEDKAFKEMYKEREITGAYKGEINFKHKAGQEIPVEITSISLTDAQGNNYFSSILRDITEKKKIENQQKTLTEEVIKKNQDLQQFSYITSHNLRAPVANLTSLLTLYNKENPADDFNQVLIEKFGQATNQLNETLNDLLNVLVIKSNYNVQKEEVNLSEVCARVSSSVESLLAETGGRIHASFSQAQTIEYNRVHLESIFLNLITNAIRYRMPGKRPELKICSYQQDKWLVIQFEDNGLGMDLKRYGDRLFGLYQRFHENEEGKGLGLYMTKAQVLAAGGKIEVESEPGKGSIFKVFFKS